MLKLTAAKKYIKGAALAVALPVIGYAQQTLIPSASSSSTGNLTGVAATSTQVTASSSNTNYVFNYSLIGSPTTAANAGNVIDLGVSADQLKTIQLLSNGNFNINNSSGFSIGGGNINSFASSTWGISNSFTVGGSELVAIGYVDLSTSQNKVGIYSLTNSTFTPSFTFTSSATPTGLGNYIGTGGTGSSLTDFRFVVCTSNNNLLDFTSTGTLGATYFIDTQNGGILQDVTVADGNLYGAFTGGYVESTAFSGLNAPAVPEPSTFALMAGGAAMLAALMRRKGRRNGNRPKNRVGLGAWG